MFLEWKCIWIFLSNQPLFLTYVSSVYIAVKWELSYRGPLLFTTSNKVKSGFSVKTNSHLFVSNVYLRSMPTRLWKAESVEDSLLYQTLTNWWGGSCTMLDCKFLRYVVSMCDKCYCILSWPEIKLLECLITSHPACVWMLWSWSVKLQMSSLSLINLTTFAWWFFIEINKSAMMASFQDYAPHPSGVCRSMQPII
jgi:hypothetical protein